MNRRARARWTGADDCQMRIFVHYLYFNLLRRNTHFLFAPSACNLFKRCLTRGLIISDMLRFSIIEALIFVPVFFIVLRAKKFS
jgi:hypothetical protein